MQDVCREMNALKRSREECSRCPLHSAPMVVLDTNRCGPGPVDVVFVGLNPGVEEVRQNAPFVGRAGRILRAAVRERLPQGTRWAMTNCILCHTPNEAKLPAPARVLRSCAPMVRAVLERYPGRLTVALGRRALSAFGIREPMREATGRVFQDSLLGLIHPSALHRPSISANISNRDLFLAGFDRIRQLLDQDATP